MEPHLQPDQPHLKQQKTITINTIGEAEVEAASIRTEVTNKMIRT